MVIGFPFFVGISLASSLHLGEFTLEVEKISVQKRVAKLSGGATLRVSDWTIKAPEGTLRLSETFAIESGELINGISFSWIYGSATASSAVFNLSQVSLRGSVVVKHAGVKMTGSEVHIKRSPFELLCISDCKVESLSSSDKADNE